MKKIIFIIALFAIILSSCKKDTTQPTNNEFNWQTTKTINVNIGANITESIGNLVKIKIYNNNPINNGVLIASGSAGYNLPFETKIKIPTDLKQIYIECIGFKRTYQIDSVAVTNNINYVFNEPTNGFKNISITEPDCSGDNTITGNIPVTITGGKTYVVSGLYTGKITFEHWNGGGTLKVCGYANLNKEITLGNNCNIIVTGNGKFSSNNIVNLNGNSTFISYPNTETVISKLRSNSVNSSIVNYSPIFICGGQTSEDFILNGKLENNGTIQFVKKFTTTSGSDVVNNGEITITDNFQVNGNNATKFINNGKIKVYHGFIQFNAPVENNCSIIGNNEMNNNYCQINSNYTSNGGLLKFGKNTGTIYFNGNGQIKLNNKSMISSYDLEVNNNIYGNGSLNSISIINTIKINKSKISGSIETANNLGTLSNGDLSNFINGATFVRITNITNYIPISDCNSIGIGTLNIIDIDGDGVADNLDEYPTDPKRAYNTYYPPNINSWNTLTFEDLWPSKGDYDFNDQVILYKYKVVSNAQNKIVDILGKYKVIAVGGSINNGFGVQFDNITPNQIESVSGYVNELENGQTNAVVVLWYDVNNVIHRVGGSMFNTIPENPIGTSDTIDIKIHLNVPLSINTVGLPPYNAFIMRTNDRGHEIHLIDKKPTNLANVNLFGTVDDASIPSQGKYYRTKENLYPWGLDIPYVFEYPIEKVEIIEAHLKFSTWVESNGIQYPDWYKNKIGYRDESKIF
jgi:LruC domain-containing protein